MMLCMQEMFMICFQDTVNIWNMYGMNGVCYGMYVSKK